jgi:hypothetical protein
MRVTTALIDTHSQRQTRYKYQWKQRDGPGVSVNEKELGGHSLRA